MQKTSRRVLAIVLALVMALSVFSISASAAVENYNDDYESTTHSVFKHTEQTLAPGVTQYTNYAYTKADGKQMVYYVTTADVTRDDVMLQVSYKGMQHESYGMEKLTQTVATANAKYSDPSNPEYISDYYSVVSATNGNGYNMTTGQPSGVWAMGGEVIQDYTGSTGFFAILKDGRPVMGKTVAEWNAYKADPGIEEAINAFGSILVWDGQPAVNATGAYYTDRASRTMMGITEDNKVILIVVDGRQEPFSCGASMAELAQIMIEAGAKYAFNLDGGGSTTYMAKNEGTDDCVILNRPSDGSERAISNGLIIASLAAPSNVFDHVVMNVENDYVMPGASVAFTATGASPAGTSAEIPAEVTYTADNGTVANGVYTAGSAAGVDTIKAVYNGQVVGSCEVNVVVPDSIEFTGASIACPYGKTTDIGVVPMYGVHEVSFVPENVTFTLGDNSFGTIDAAAMTFTATDAPLSNTKTTLTVSTNCEPSVSATVDLQVGKGSEVIWDFEDQKTDEFSLFDYYNSGVRGSFDIVNSETGKVRNGDYALAINYDFSQLTYYEDYIDLMFCHNAEQMKAHGNTKDADGVIMGGAPEDFTYITGATGIGMWIYIPDEVDAKGLNPRFFFGFKKTATSAWTRGTSGMKLLVDVQHLPTDNWYYYYADLSAYSSYAALTLECSRSLASNGTSKNGQKGYPTNYYAGPCFEFYVEDSAWKGYNNKSYNSKFTLYIDDYTVDYSSVVADREAPEFGSAVYATTGMWQAETFTDGITMTNNDVDFGINASSAKAYIDGNEVACTYKNGKIAIDKALVLADGPHTVKFTVEDNNGNMGYKNLNFVVNTGSGYDTIVVKPHDETLTETPVGSLYYIDLVATDISKIKSATATLKVNNVNDWEPQGAVVADGFEMAYTNEIGDAGELTVTITKTGEVTESGEAVLASIPIRAWYPHNDLGMDSSWIITTKKCVYPMDIQMVTKAGSIEYVDSAANIGAFSADKIQIDSEAMCEYGYIGVQKGDATSWHTHDAQPMEDKPATCTEDGYTGRTFCADCNSVIDWGTVVPATGHNYVIVDGVLKCEHCGDLFNGEFTDGKTYIDGVPAQGWVDNKYYDDGVFVTGIVPIDGVYYEFNDEGISQGKYTGLVQDEDGYAYAKIGVLSGGWIDIDGDWYYFDETTLRNVATLDNGYVVYDFEEDGKLVSGKWYTDKEGTKYYYGPDFYHSHAVTSHYDMFADIDGDRYCFNYKGYRYENDVVPVCESNTEKYLFCYFDKDGKFTGIANGLTDWAGNTYYLFDGQTIPYYGLVEDGGYYYYVNDGGKIVKNADKYINTDNGILVNDKSVGKTTQHFDENGRMVVEEIKNGLVGDYYYENDKKIAYKGLILVDGYYYYVNDGGKIVKDMRKYVTTANGLTPNGIVVEKTYQNFDSEGHMFVEIPKGKNGLIGDYYYENDKKIAYKGLILVDGYYYYVNDGGKIVKNADKYINTDNGERPDR